jgi:hypothetical protein
MDSCHIRLSAVTGSVESNIKKEKRGIFISENRCQMSEDRKFKFIHEILSSDFCPLFIDF